MRYFETITPHLRCTVCAKLKIKKLTRTGFKEKTRRLRDWLVYAQIVVKVLILPLPSFLAECVKEMCKEWKQHEYFSSLTTSIMYLLCDEALAFIIAWTPYRESSMDSVEEYQVSEAHEWEPSSAILQAWSQPFPSSFIFGKSFSKDLSRNNRQTANQGRVMTMDALRHPSAREAMKKERSSKNNSNQEKVDSRSRWRFRLLIGSCTCLHFKESPLTRKDVLWGWGMYHTHKQVLTLTTLRKCLFYLPKNSPMIKGRPSSAFEGLR